MTSDQHSHDYDLDSLAGQVRKTWGNALDYIKREGFVFDGKGGGQSVERWEKLAFSLYTDLCDLDNSARHYLDEEPDGSAEHEASGDEARLHPRGERTGVPAVYEGSAGKASPASPASSSDGPETDDDWPVPEGWRGEHHTGQD